MMSAIEEGKTGYKKYSVPQRKEGVLVIRAPESLYSAIAFVPTLGMHHDNKASRCVMSCIFLPLVSSGFLSAVAHVTATHYVMEMNNDNNKTFEESNPNGSICERPETSEFLAQICLCVFTMTCLADVQISGEEARMVLFLIGCGLTRFF